MVNKDRYGLLLEKFIGNDYNQLTHNERLSRLVDNMPFDKAQKDMYKKIVMLKICFFYSHI